MISWFQAFAFSKWVNLYRYTWATASQRAVVRLVRGAAADPRGLLRAGALAYPTYAAAGVSLSAPPAVSVRDVVVGADFAALPALGFRLWWVCTR